jgi:plasmid stability protein
MASLQVRDIDERIYNHLKTRAKLQKRSISQEVVAILEQFLSSPTGQNKNATEEFLKLSDAWQDNRPADEIIDEMRKTRKNSGRFGEKNVIFD